MNRFARCKDVRVVTAARGSLSTCRMLLTAVLSIALISSASAMSFPWNGPVALLGTTSGSRSADDVIVDSTNPGVVYVTQTGGSGSQGIIKLTLTTSGGLITGATQDYFSESTLAHDGVGIKSLDIYNADTIYYTMEEGQDFGGSDDGGIGRLTGLAGVPTHTAVAGLRSVRAGSPASDFDPEGIAINAAANALYVFTDDGPDTGIAKFDIDPGTNDLIQSGGGSAAVLSPTPIWSVAVEAGTTNGNDGIVLADGRVAVVAGSSSVNIYAVTDSGASASVANLLGGSIASPGGGPQDLLQVGDFLYVGWEGGVIQAYDLTAGPSATPTAVGSINLDIELAGFSPSGVSLGGLALSTDGHLLVSTRAAGGSTGEIYALNLGTSSGSSIPVGTGGTGQAIDGLYSFAGVTFDQAGTPDQLQLLGGETGSPFVDGSAGFARNVTFSVGFVAEPTAGPPYTPRTGFDASKSVGRLAFDQFSHFEQADGDTSAHYAAAVNLPGGNDGTVDRHGLEFGWSDGTARLINRPSEPDLVIYESGTEGTPEAFMVRVRKESDGLFSDWMYAAAEGFELYADEGPGGDGAFAHLFDLSDFGFLIGEAADLIQIANLMPGDTIDDSLFGGDGTRGFVLFDGSGNAISTGALGGGTYASSQFDPDILYVGASLVIPEPATAFTLCLGVAGLVVRRRRSNA